MKQLIVIAFLLSFSAAAQYDSIRDTTRIEAIIHERFPESELLFFETGDLNADRTTDIVAVVSRPCGTNEADIGKPDAPTVCRRVLFIVQKDNYFRIAAANDYAIDCSYCGGGWNMRDAYDGLYIEDGTVSFFNLYGACEQELFIYSYRWNNEENDWLMDTRSRLTGRCDDPEKGFIPAETTTAADFGRISFNDPKILKKL